MSQTVHPIGKYYATPPSLSDGELKHLRVNVSDELVVAAGTGATSLGKAEDAAHTSGDVGVEILSKRTDTAASSAGADGDYATVNTDSLGHVWNREGYAPSYEDNTVGVAKAEQRFSATRIVTATTTTVKSGAGFLHSLVFNKHVATDVVTVYDNTAASGTVIAIITSGAALLSDPPQTALYDITFSTGLTIVTSQATDLTVSYR